MSYKITYPLTHFIEMLRTDSHFMVNVAINNSVYLMLAN